MKNTWSRTVFLALVSLAVAASAFSLANFGAPAWVFVLLLGWMVTVGLPTFVAIVVTAFFWNGVSLPAFLATVTTVALVLQLGALRFVQSRVGARRV